MKPEIVQQVEKTFDAQARNKTRIAVHVRRGEYEEFFLKKFHNITFIDNRFFKAAMSWCRKHLNGSLSFLVVSDDPEWCEEHLVEGEPDVQLATKSAVHDLALISMSDHVIYAYGTYGLWGALQVSERGGHVITLDLQHKNVAKLYHTWHLAKYTELKKMGKKFSDMQIPD